MTTLRIGQPVEFKPVSGLGGWRSGGVVTGFVGKLIEVREGDWTHPLKPSHVRPSREDTRPDRGALQAAARAQMREEIAAGLLAELGPEALPGLLEHGRPGWPTPARTKRLVMAPPPMDTEEPEEVIPRDVEPVAMRAVYPGTGAARVPAFAPQPKAPKPTRSQAFLKFVRMQPCAITGEMSEDAHHYENGGMGRKCSDYMTVPLTHEQHMRFHAGGVVSEVYEAAVHRGETFGSLATKLAMAEAGWRALVAFIERKEGGEDE